MPKPANLLEKPTISRVDTIPQNEVVEREMNLEIRSIDEGKHQIEMVISSDAIDSYGTRFNPNGVVLDRYRNNPIVVYRHLFEDGIYSLPIGRGLVDTIRVEDGKLYMTIEFTSKETFEFGNQVYRLLKEKFLNAGSIGARILEDRLVTENDHTIVVFEKWELLEFSIVPIGANPDALVSKRSMDSGHSVKEIREIESDLANRFMQLRELETAKRNEDPDDEVIEPTDEEDIEETIDREEFNKYRDYFNKVQPLVKQYRNLMGAVYRQIGIVQPIEEEDAVRTVLALIKPSKDTTPVERAPSAEEVRQYTVKLTDEVVSRVLENLANGYPIRKRDQLIAKVSKEVLS